jgi:parallel beta-helix repeat protein
VTDTGRAARRRAARRKGRPLQAGLGGALVAGVALFALGLQDATPAPLADLFDTSRTRAVADQHAVEQPAVDPGNQVAPALPAPAPQPAPQAVAPEQPVGPVAPPAASMPTGPVINVPKGGSISAALAKAKPGDTVLVPGGTYSGGLDVGVNGAPGKPITIQAVPGQKVTITGGGGGNGLVSLDGRSNITMIGISVKGSGSHGIFAQGAKNIVLRDCEVADSQDGGIVFLESSNIKVQRCDIHGNNARGTSASNEAMSFDHTDGFEISFSKVHGNGEEGIDAKYESNAGKIFSNTVDGNRGPNIYIDSAENVEVFNNTVTGTTEDSKAGISIAVENLSDTKRAANIKVYNNVVRGNAGGGIGFWTESSGTFSGIQILNNTVVNNSGSDLKIDGGNFSGLNILRNNILGNAGGTGSFKSDSNIIGGIAGLLDNTLKVVAGSKAIGAGNPDGAPIFDITGAKRTGGIDIGAFEHATDNPAAALTGLVNDIQAATGQLTAGLATAVLGSATRAPTDASDAQPAAPAPAAQPDPAPEPASDSSGY